MHVYLEYLYAFYLYKVLRDNDVTQEELTRDDDESREHPTADIPREHHDSRPQNQHEHEHDSIIPQAAQVIPTLNSVICLRNEAVHSFVINYINGLFPLPDLDSDSDSDTDSCTMQDFSIGSYLDSDPLIEMCVI